MPEPICAAEFTYTKEIHLAFTRCFFRHFTIKRFLLAEVLYPLIAFLLYFLIMMIEGKPIHTVDACCTGRFPRWFCSISSSGPQWQSEFAGGTARS